MPIIAEVGRRNWRIRTVILIIYAVLALLGVTMVYPFLITLTASVTTELEYNRFAPTLGGLWSREERFTRSLVPYFPTTMRFGMDHFALLFDQVPGKWNLWQTAGSDPQGMHTFAAHYLAQAANPARLAQVRQIAADYDEFATTYPIDDSICALNQRMIAPFLRERYYRLAIAHGAKNSLFGNQVEGKALELLGERWETPLESFYQVVPDRELQTPWDQQNFFPLADGRAKDFLGLRQAYRDRQFIPTAVKRKWRRVQWSPPSRGLSGDGELSLTDFNAKMHTEYKNWSDIPTPPTERDPVLLRLWWREFTGRVIPACETRPFPLKMAWFRHLNAMTTRLRLNIKASPALTIEEYNKNFHTHYAALRDTPFPIPPTAPAPLRAAWADYVQHAYPLRLMRIAVTPEKTALFRAFVQLRFHGDLARYNRILNANATSWDSIPLTAAMPAENEAQASLWMEFVRLRPVSEKRLNCAEIAYQRSLLKKYGTLAEINHRYGWKLSSIEQAEMPFDMACLVTFINNDRALFIDSLTENYRYVADYLVLRGRAVFNTVVLVLLTLLAALTINPLAAYALSRFQMRQMPAIILFMLATMAFPAAVSMIPGYLLMRDLHMLNTYAALILPGIANGMSIFLLKGFFDSLPPELYEAAALDGAKEWQVFLRITLPLSKPILAVIALNSFMGAYNGWEWALVVCQNPKMWTLAVWLYQFNNVATANMPWAVMASFVIASLPVFLVFIFCQNIILRGIILPQMK